eukprot:CAMPEP_0182428432 /NCGR_PEP_ID=MMETSP1167-20130531/23024_1 /TAXON_ID=2988 /ORGANISM="Mallomonas Sp, Strain CCMP3275" /LENGTH=245 /DNA_ID=CAMNT_0024611355 /DNA_START=327 /DNA_END=1067 /DNA_ORIENTATION=+
MAQIVLQEEGIGGFYGGVGGVMFGEAFVKATLFGANAFALNKIAAFSHMNVASLPFFELCLAAAFSGAVASILITPIERVKILMQSDKTGKYSSELDCLQQVLAKDGLIGWLTRGLDGTVIRELPATMIYFGLYSVLIHSTVGEMLGPVAPLLCGGVAGTLSWAPNYHSDVIKTHMQHTHGGADVLQDGSGDMINGYNYFDTAKLLYKRDGSGVFFEGMAPKLMRAGVNHAVTFLVYDYIMKTLA